jgi:hypothetical protein
MNWSLDEIYSLPIPMRDWFFQDWMDRHGKKEE